MYWRKLSRRIKWERRRGKGRGEVGERQIKRMFERSENSFIVFFAISRNVLFRNALLPKTDLFLTIRVQKRYFECQVTLPWLIIWIIECFVGPDRFCGLLLFRVPGYRSRGLGFDSRHYRIFCKVVGLELGPVSLVSKTEELLGRKRIGSGLEKREYSRRNPLCWPRNTPYPQELTLTSPTSSRPSVGVVRLRTEATEFVFVCCLLQDRPIFQLNIQMLCHWSVQATDLIRSREESRCRKVPSKQGTIPLVLKPPDRSPFAGRYTYGDNVNR
jgi:hypothetical protein